LAGVDECSSASGPHEDDEYTLTIRAIRILPVLMINDLTEQDMRIATTSVVILSERYRLSETCSRKEMVDTSNVYLEKS
jgi:hypothetical protein